MKTQSINQNKINPSLAHSFHSFARAFGINKIKFIPRSNPSILIYRPNPSLTPPRFKHFLIQFFPLLFQAFKKHDFIKHSLYVLEHFFIQLCHFHKKIPLYVRAKSSQTICKKICKKMKLSTRIKFL